MNATLENPAAAPPAAPVSELELMPADSVSNEDVDRADLPAIFNEFRQELEKLKLSADNLRVTDVNDKLGMKTACLNRIAFKNLRVAVDKRRKELGEVYRQKVLKVNGTANEILALIRPYEEKMEALEEFGARETMRLEDERRTARTAELSPYLSGPCPVDLGKISDDEYARLLTDSKDLHELRTAREKREKEEAEAQARAEAEERERILLENEELKRQAAEREAAANEERERLTAERQKEREESQAREREALRKEKEASAERERLAAAERQKERAALEEAARLERDRLKAETAQREAEAQREREAAAERQREADRIASDERTAREKLEKAEADRKAAEAKKAKEEAAAAKKAAAAPDVEKLRTLAGAQRAMSLPRLTNDAANMTLAESRIAWVDEIEALAKRLEGGTLL